MLWMAALHPEEVPPGTTTFTVDYLVDGQVLVPPSGERAKHVMPDE